MGGGNAHARSRRPRHAGIALVAFASLALASPIVSCGVGDVDLTGLACPCVRGYICNTSTNTCVAAGGDSGSGPSIDAGADTLVNTHDGTALSDASADTVSPTEAAQGDSSMAPPFDGGGVAEGGGSVCTGCQVLFTNAGTVAALTEDASGMDTTSLYWLTTTGVVASGSRKGGAITTLSTGTHPGKTLSVNDGYFFWSGFAPANTQSDFWQCSLPNCMATRQSAGTAPYEVSSVALIPDSFLIPKPGSAGSIQSFPYGNDAGPTTFAPNQPNPNTVIFPSGEIYWSNAGTGASDGDIRTCAIIEPNDISITASGLDSPNHITSSPAEFPDLYLTLGSDMGPMKIAVCPLIGAICPQTLATDPLPVTGLAADDYFLYWIDANDVTSISLAADAGAPVVLAQNVHPTAIFVDATTLYWGQTDGRILSLPTKQ